MPRVSRFPGRFAAFAIIALALGALLIPAFGETARVVASGNYPDVRESAWQKQDDLAPQPARSVAGVAGRLNDMSFNLSGALLSAPHIDTLSPNPIPRSGLLRIVGANFGTSPTTAQLKIDGKAPTYIAYWSDNLIVAYVPEASALGNVQVEVTTAAGTGSAPLNVTTRSSDGRIRWRFTVAGDYVPRRAAVGPDGTVYFNDERGRLYALTPDGGLKWVFRAGLVGARGPVSVGTDGTVYVGGLVPKNPSTPCEDDQYTVNVEGIFAVRPDGTQKWLFDKTCDNLLSGPNVGPDGNIHAVTELGIGAFALNPDGTLAHTPTGRFGVDGDHGTEIVFGPAAPGQAPTQKYFQYESGGLFGYTLDGQRVFLYQTNAVGITQPVAGQRTGTVYTTPDQQTAGRLFAVSPQGALRWVSPIRPIHSLSIPDAPPSESAVYIVQDGARLHRVNPEDGSVVWTYTDGQVLFAPVASPDDRLALMGGRVTYGKPGFFAAVSSDGRLLWKQQLPEEPGLDPYGQVVPISRAMFTRDGQTAYIAADVAGDNPTATNPVYSFFYALDTSDSNISVNQPPQAFITGPAPGTQVPKNTPLEVTAEVQDDGEVSKVDFYYNLRGTTHHFGTDTTAPYSATFNASQPDTYGIFAVATDAGGLTGESPLLSIYVSNQAPSISWVSPANGASFDAGATITLTARASDADGTVSRVQFYSSLLGHIGTDTTPDAAGNYSVEFVNPPKGTHEINAWADDDSGTSRAATITITVGSTPPPATRLNHALAANGGVAACSTYFTSPAYGTYPAAAVNDGSRRGPAAGTLWLDNTRSAFPDWVEVGFGGAKSVSEVIVVTQQDDASAEPTDETTFTRYGVTTFEVRYWTGAAWAAVPGGTVTGNNKVVRRIAFSPVTTTKIRVVVTAGADNAYSRLVEVEAWGEAPPPPPPPARLNHALSSNGGVASASSYFSSPAYGTYPAAAVNDGARRALNGALWLDSTSAAFPDWVEVSFGGTKSVDEVNVVTQQDAHQNPSEPTEALTFAQYGVTAFEVQYWTGTQWQAVPGGAVTGNNKVWRKLTFPAVTTTKVRVVVTGGKDNTYSRLVEVEAWGASAATPKVNHALASNGGAASSSSHFADAYWGTYPASAVIDGSRRGPAAGTLWLDKTPGAWPDWVEVAFSGTKSVTEVVVVTQQDDPSAEPTEQTVFTKYGATAFEVQYWTGAAWAAVPGGAITGNDKVIRRLSFPAVSTAKIRVVVTGGKDNTYSRLVEVEAY